MMVIISININKTNNHLSSELTEHKREMTYDVGNLGPGLGKAQKHGGVKPINWIQTLPS
jgi:hypothetical protein